MEGPYGWRMMGCGRRLHARRRPGKPHRRERSSQLRTASSAQLLLALPPRRAMLTAWIGADPAEVDHGGSAHRPVQRTGRAVRRAVLVRRLVVDAVGRRAA